MNCQKNIDNDEYDKEMQELYDNLKKNLIESGDIATDTLSNLHIQGEDIKKIDDGVDVTDVNVKKSETILKNISFMRNMFGFFTKSKKKRRNKKSKVLNESTPNSDNLIKVQKSLVVKDTFEVRDIRKITNETKKLREDIDEITHLARRLTIMSEEMNTELECQNEFLGKVTDKMDDTNYKVKRLNKMIRRI
jgi:ElaB/YqjD/DUF883 family membrane-anchored ribosome-binding protein